MPAYIALLRAVNVGGTGKLPMAELKAMCEAEGYSQVQTYIASGNVVFASRDEPARIQSALESRLQAYAGKPVGLLLRTAKEMADVLAADPFPQAAPNHVMTIFLQGPPPDTASTDLRGHKDEELQLGTREIYVHYPSGMGSSKFVISAGKSGTVRNRNTVAKLVELASRISSPEQH